VLRFWREWSAAGPRWRGRIEHLQSGEATTSLDLQGIAEFIRQHGVMAEATEMDGTESQSVRHE
jgi:hypothetical protein